MARGQYQKNPIKLGWKPIVILGAVAVGAYALSPAGRHWLMHGSPRPEQPADLALAEARQRRMSSVEIYERAAADHERALRDLPYG